MRPEDLGKFLEAAFEKIEPVDDAHREKLAKMREKLRQINEEGARELAKAKEEFERQRNTRPDFNGEIEARKQIAKETREALVSSFNEHTELIDRIAGR